MSTVARKRGVKARRFTKDEFYRMGEQGFFHGQRVELIEGKLMVFSPQQPRHANAVHRATRVLAALFGITFLVRAQLPIDFGAISEPEPDEAVVPGPESLYETAHPTTAVLIVEVSDSTLWYDRGRKASLYASRGIRDYWIINIADGQLEVYRDPVADPSQHYGWRYSSRTDLVPGQNVTPLALPGATLAVADLFA